MTLSTRSPKIQADGLLRKFDDQLFEFLRKSPGAVTYSKSMKHSGRYPPSNDFLSDRGVPEIFHRDTDVAADVD